MLSDTIYASCLEETGAYDYGFLPLALFQQIVGKLSGLAKKGLSKIPRYSGWGSSLGSRSFQSGCEIFILFAYQQRRRDVLAEDAVNTSLHPKPLPKHLGAEISNCRW